MTTKLKSKSFAAASTNEVGELLGLMQTINGLINKDYIHIADMLTQDFKNSIDKDIERLINELDSRD